MTWIVAITAACGNDGGGDGGDSTGGGSSSSESSSSSSSGADVSSGTTEPQLCGNGALDPGESCDGTMFAGDDTCMTQGFAAGDLLCTGDCLGFSTAECIISICGNGTIEGAEECEAEDVAEMTCVDLEFDDGMLGCDDECRFDTTMCVAFSCGDGAINGKTEECDTDELDDTTCE
ncbi:MAG TPA: hypothetical protein VFG69_04830, partial [Nannocystaceae bacterium]|nr:hypothetical protein [Nannocystaceae bacterium]